MLPPVSKPLVVPDLNFLQSRPANKEYLSAKVFWLWPMRIFQEVADKNSQAEDYMKKLFRILRLNYQRVGVAAHAETLTRIELEQKRDVKMRDLIDYRMTQIVGMAAEADDYESFTTTLCETTNQHLNLGHNLFWSLLKISCDTPLETPIPSRFMDDLDIARKYISDETSWAYFMTVTRHFSRHTADDMPSLSDLNPNHSHLLGMAKCMHYIRTKIEKRGLVEKDLNDYDDLQYAIYASYTGHIATSDKGLTRMIRVCFPSTQFYDKAA